MKKSEIRGYRLNNEMDLSISERLYIITCCDLIDQTLSLRDIQRINNIPITNMHNFVYHKLPDISTELYEAMKKQLQWNKKNARYFRDRRSKYV